MPLANASKRRRDVSFNDDDDEGNVEDVTVDEAMSSLQSESVSQACDPQMLRGTLGLKLGADI
jgi:hypothetical protein